MKIAAMAAGAVGAYFGGRMQAGGHDVAYIARRAHLDALRKNGLKIESVHGDLHIPKPNVTDDPAKVGPVDIVLFAVKLWDTETAAEAARPLLGTDSRLITFQNGVDNVDRLSSILGSDRVLGGAAYIATVIASPGVIKHTSQFATLRFGRADKKPDAKLSAFVVFILVGARVFSLTFYGVNGHVWVEHLLTSLPGGQLGFLIVVNILIFVLAFFLDFFELSFIIIPLVGPVAEKLGLIRLVDHRVLELAIAELAASPNVRLSLNISPATIASYAGNIFSSAIGIAGSDLRYNLTWHDWLNLESLILVSQSICEAALARVVAHCRRYGTAPTTQVKDATPTGYTDDGTQWVKTVAKEAKVVPA